MTKQPSKCPKCHSENIELMTRGADIGEAVGMAASGATGAAVSAGLITAATTTTATAATTTAATSVTAGIMASSAAGAGGAIAAVSDSDVDCKWKIIFAGVGAVAAGIAAFLHFAPHGRESGRKVGEYLDDGILKKYRCVDCRHTFK